MEINFLELWARMGFPVRAVVCVLTLQALGCVAVVIDRVIVLLSSRQKARTFAGKVQGAVDSEHYDQALQIANQQKGDHLASYLALGLKTFLTRLRAGDDKVRAAELTRRALERKGDAISRDLNRGMNVLASTGSTAPFVGLLGTVLGIINAFKLIAANGSGGIGTIGAAIGEALVVTGYGLVVAIPSVLVFNWLSGRIADYESGLINAGSELLDRLETGTGPGSADAAAAPDTSGEPLSKPHSASALGRAG
ncbi:MAG: MotA/TolQ/ExbB proton channel family protein [Polyangiales bacterium]